MIHSSCGSSAYYICKDYYNFLHFSSSSCCISCLYLFFYVSVIFASFRVSNSPTSFIREKLRPSNSFSNNFSANIYSIYFTIVFSKSSLTFPALGAPIYIIWFALNLSFIYFSERLLLKNLYKLLAILNIYCALNGSGKVLSCSGDGCR